MTSRPERRAANLNSNFLAGGGEMGARIRSFDWSASPIGPVEQWPQSLKTAVRIMLTSRHPMFAWWGEQLINLYNDAYKETLGRKHPQALGQPAVHVWREIWPQIGPLAESAILKNEGTFEETTLFIVERKGYLEETYCTFSYSPLPDDRGGTGGLICANTDETERVVNERRLALLKELAANGTRARTPVQACTLSARCLETNQYDLPFALIYLIDSEKQRVCLAATSGIYRGHAAAPETISFNDESVWAFGKVTQTHGPCLISDLGVTFDDLPKGAWARPPHQALALPIAGSSQTDKYGILVAALNPFRPFDQDYGNFLDLVAGQIAASITNAQAYEEERKRAEAPAAMLENRSAVEREHKPSPAGETERRRTQQKRAVELIAMSRLHELSTRLIQAQELQPLLEEILDATMAMLKADFGNVQLYNPGTRALKIVAQRGFQQEFLDYFDQVHEGTGACGLALQLRRRIVVEDVETEPAFAPHLAIVRAAGYRAVQSTPLFSRRGELLGMISTHFHQRHRPSEQELRLTDLYARQAAELIERKQGEEALRTSQEQMQAIWNNIPAIMFIKDHQGRYRDVNSLFSKLTSLPRDQILGKTDAEIFPPEQATVFHANDATVLEEKRPIEFEEIAAHEDGPHISIVHKFPLRDTRGEPDAICGIVIDITERKRMETALRDSEERFRHMVEGVKDYALFMVDVGGQVVTWNNGAERMTGYSAQEILGRHFSLFYEPDDVESGKPEKALKEAAAAGRFEAEGWQVRKDGSRFWANVIVAPVKSETGELQGFAKMTRDMSERKLVEQSLRETHERAEMILDSITDKFFGVDKDWRYTHFNKQAEEQLKVLGKDPASLVGKVLWDEFPNPPSEQALRRAMSERVATTDEYFYAPLGEWVEDRIYPSPNGGLAIFVRYTTERKRTEEELRKTQAELTHVTRMTTMGELVASIAHEINQPLGAIVNNANTSLRFINKSTRRQDNVSEILSDIIHDANRASAIIARIRGLTRKTPTGRTSLQLALVVADVLALARRELADRQIAVHTQLTETLPSISGHRVELQQVLLNLVMNASDAMRAVPDERKVLIIEGRCDTLNDRPAVLIAVHDLGEGFRGKDPEQFFEAFNTTKPHGLGMGLRISRTIVEAHGGRLWGTPNQGPGATFFCILPAENE